MALTVALALQDALTRLERVPSSPRSDAEELRSRVLGTGRGALRLLAARELTAAQGETFERWLTRREAGEPVQYITGRAAFRDLDLAVDSRVLVPRPETEGLVEAVLVVLAAERTRGEMPRVLDLGTGSGAIALALAQEAPHARVTAVDASEGALQVARANAEACALADRVTFVHGDWFGGVAEDERFEVVVSNPPYIAESDADSLPADVRDWEPHEALFSGPDGLDAPREIVDTAPRHLVAGGLLALELSESHAHEVAAWLEGAHDWRDVRVLDDLSGRPRVLLARRERGPAIAPAQWGEERR
ncbi:MAG: peptide chain release factor N(5)-glutamine methyltransferase [Candidatus Eisenbacteria bacterium]|uniref:Release factor glutamine methyltransferase n=1 Tax=Eiseniibacteriota bacterium TaxID=2212470 RepID=A0A933SB68_UNCEI|nr:peptide chain release factor N(5)-glutamine methyltransferase [Candidatus Eisenbacteria bacterium]